ncbi:MAG: methyltransferase domain-containing protein [bacterium]|nr:methyltransferase domain-containing protein [bacterium]
MGDRDRGDRQKWNRKYRDKGPESFGSEPAEWLVAHRDLLTPEPHGRALDVACGNGRNAAYLARLGFTVDALDVSGVVIAWLRERVDREGLSVHPRCCDLTRGPLPPREYQVVLNFNFLQRDLFAALKDATAPGGLVVFESFTRLQVELPRGPSDPEHTLEAGELRRAFADFEILDYREKTLFPEDVQKTRAMASLVARRPDR